MSIRRREVLALGVASLAFTVGGLLAVRCCAQQEEEEDNASIFPGLMA